MSATAGPRTGPVVRRRARGAVDVHPGAWWGWALLVAAAATTTTNVLVLALLLVAVCLVVASCADEEGRARLRPYLAVAAAVVVIRVLFRLVFPVEGGTALLTLPTLHLGPLDLFGTLTVQALASGISGGLQLAVVILAVGAAHTLADVLDLLKHAPPALAGLSTSLVIAASVFPGLGRSVVEVRRAARLRGGLGWQGGLSGLGGRARRRRAGGPVAPRAASRTRRWTATVIPVLEGTMDQALTLATAMEARGYGSREVATTTTTTTATATATARRPGPSWLQPACVLGALACVALAAYGLFDSAWPRWVPPALAAAAVLAVVVAGRVDRGRRRSVYRPAPWTLASTLVLTSAALAALALLVLVPAAIRQPPPVLVPDLTVLALLAPLVAAVPALLAPAREPAPSGGPR